MAARSQTDADSREEIEENLTHLLPREPFPQYIDDTLFLDVQELLAQHPDKTIQQWSDKPRLYTLLRMLGYDDEGNVFTKFDTEQITDFWLPLTAPTLHQLAASTNLTPSHVRRTQLHILSKSEQMSEEKLLSSVHSHRHIQYGSAHFEELGKIGRGGSAEVTRVRHKLSGKEFACKRISRAETIKAQRSQLIEFRQEVQVLQKISHHHLVSFIASFTDLTSFSLILNPVAKDVLKSMLERQSRDQPLSNTDIATLRHSFGCLATALSYLHEKRVRHKDIKPGNILLSEGRVYLCDFGISRDWSLSENSTTEGDVLKFTRRYCAPEVFGRDPRNTKSDIWSLGCVFLEMISVVKGYPLEELNHFLLSYSVDASAQGLWCAPESMNAWLVNIRSEKNDSADDLPLDWIIPMIRTEAEERLNADEVVGMIHKQTADLPRCDMYMPACCRRSDSILPIEAVDSPTLAHPQADGLGIFQPSSPPRYLGLPPRNESPVSLNRPSMNSSFRGRSMSRDRSVSPRTQDYNVPRDSNDTVPFTMDPIFASPPTRPIQHISTRAESHRSSSLSFPQAPGSIASSSGFRRSPVPPPAGFEVKCACAGLPNEKHIFNAPFLSSIIERIVPTTDICTKCEMGENKVQIYESTPDDANTRGSQMPLLWWVTRRLVISYLSGTPEMRRCSSFWVPLADVRFASTGTEVVLRWSDCNQMTQRRSGNYSQHYDWLYDPKEPNNSLIIRFNDKDEAQHFMDVVRLPYEDGITVRQGRKVDVSDTQELHTFEVGRRGIRNYRVATLTTLENSFANSKLFVQWPELDIDIHIPRYPTTTGYQLIVQLNNVSTPTYHSDIRGEPSVDHKKIGRFQKAHLLKSSFMATFSLGMQPQLPIPPFGTTFPRTVPSLANNVQAWSKC
ncbi:kinase-like domain-containing protein [Dendryphion nanum]|uniref:Kinase-like domain-containing protein n=1 Tax=Dendryphion nanum TaxID=256645 RepID=A0A9P9D5R5_9PLEO|nr:kinase-like domain-containing protein [Dendryphion nanum]